jgi:hypothetical protein
MCKYKLSINQNQTVTCGVQDADIPADSDGLCIFHSENLRWKVEMDFNTHFKKLLKNLLNKINTEKSNGVKLPFHGFIMINSNTNNEISSDFLIEDVYNKDEIDFCYSKFYCNVIFQNCTFREGRFENVEFKEKATFRNVSFNGNAYFTNVSFYNHVLFYQCVFDDFVFFDKCQYYESDSGPANLRIEEVIFKGDFDFSKSKCSHHVLFKNVIFELTADFDNTSFQHEFMWDTIKVHDVAHFKGTRFNKPTASSSFYFPVHLTDIFIAENGSIVFQGNKPLDDVVKGELFLKLNPLSSGKILFRDFNFKRINSKTRKELLELEKEGIVEIGDGCQKYYCQTGIFEIRTNESNQKFILDITKVFCNYFEFQQGVNLGVEIVSKNADGIKYFYFTDEKISQEDFLARIKQEEKNLWFTFHHLIQTTSLTIPVNQIEFRNILSDLGNIFSKIGNTIIGGGNFTSSDLNTVLGSIAPFGEQIINSGEEVINQLSKHQIQINHITYIMGDIVSGGSTSIKNSNITDSFNTINKQYGEDISDAVKELSELIKNQSNQGVVKHFGDFTKELSQPTPKKERLKMFWNSLTSALPNILTMTNIVEKITKLF